MRTICQPAKKTYKVATNLLESRRREWSSRWRAEENRYRAQGNSTAESFRGRSSLEPMGKWLRQLGYADTKVKIIHVAGTKGKGSTCAITESLLREHGKRVGFPSTTGLFTSPPLITTRERIRINGQPISEDLFATRFFEVWDKLWQNCQDLEDMPRRRQLLMLFSLHVFEEAGVDVAIYETYCGGEYDCTNIVQPTVTGITTLSLDHVRMLGPTIREVAWHKSGIFKPKVPAYSSPQEPTAAAVLHSRAIEKQSPLKYVAEYSSLPLLEAPALRSKVQKTNASLAIALTNALLENTTQHQLSPQDILRGMKHFSWPGRFHEISDGNFEWFLDIAHNELSLRVATKWYVDTIRQRNHSCSRILIFRHLGDRDRVALLRTIADTLREGNIQLQHIIFTSSKQRRDGSTNIDFKDTNDIVTLDIQQDYKRIWESIDPSTKISLTDSVEEALAVAKDIGDMGNGMQTLITGAINLVGCALPLLDQRPHAVSHESRMRPSL